MYSHFHVFFQSYKNDNKEKKDPENVGEKEGIKVEIHVTCELLLLRLV